MGSLSVGILGCGNISDRYFKAGEEYESFDVTACADLDLDRAHEKATAYDIEGMHPDELCESSTVDLIVNLTPPAVHEATSIAALEAGKHVYTEKPFAADTAGAEHILETAAEHGVLVGSAPDTILGSGIQTVRQAIDDGVIGDPIGATAFFVGPGHDHWHPNPEIFYRSGGGPLFDMGPYYVSALTYLLGPVDAVYGSTRQPFSKRPLALDPANDTVIDVSVPTYETGLIEFERGATATAVFSYDTHATTIAPQSSFEIHGTEGTLLASDPNHFEGQITVRSASDAEWHEIPPVDGPPHQQRGLGVADLAKTLNGDWTQITSGKFGAHVLATMDGIRTASETGTAVSPSITVEQPPALPTDADDW